MEGDPGGDTQGRAESEEEGLRRGEAEPTDLGGETNPRLELHRVRRRVHRRPGGERVAAHERLANRWIAEQVKLRDVLEDPSRDQAIQERASGRVAGVEVADHEIDGLVAAIVDVVLLVAAEQNGALTDLGDPAT